MELFTFPLNSFSPIDEQIYIQIRHLITEHNLDGVSELPPTRELAIFLKQSQADVASAYRQLEIEGYAKRIDDKFILPPLDIASESPSTNSYKSDYTTVEKEFPYDFQPSVVDQKHFPIERWKQCLLEATSTNTIYAAGAANGENFLKEVLQAYLLTHRDIDVSPNNIFISSSVRNSVTRFAMFLKEKGYFDSFVMENPGSKDIFNIFISLDYNFSTYNVRPEGHQINEIPDERKLLYLTPSQHQPLGITLPIEQRFQLISWAQRTDSLIIEDDTSSDYRYNGRLITPMASMNSEHIIYTGSFARNFLPSLKISYLIIPDRFVKEYSEYNEILEQSTSALSQLAIANFMKKGYFNEHLKKMNAIYEQKMTVLSTKIMTTLPDTVKIYSEDAGQYLLIQPNNEMTEEELISSAEKMGVKVYGTSEYFLENREASSPIILLGFGNLSRPDMLTGIELLAKAWFE